MTKTYTEYKTLEKMYKRMTSPKTNQSELIWVFERYKMENNTWKLLWKKKGYYNSKGRVIYL